MSEHPQGVAIDSQQSSKQVPGNPLRIEFFKPSTKPPVFVSGSFTSWDPVELAVQPVAAADKPDDVRFYKEFPNVPDGEQQFKFKLGAGDWWTTDESVTTTTDEHGNKNNVIMVKNDLVGTPSSMARATPSRGVERETEHFSTDKNQITTNVGSSPSQPAPDALKHADKTSIVNAIEDNAKSQSSLPDAKPAGADTTAIKKAATTAAEVADSAAKLDTTPPKKALETVESHTDQPKKDATSSSADQLAANAIAAKAVEQSTGEVKLPPSKPADTITSPSMPPAPVVTPAASSPSVAATKPSVADIVPPLPAASEPLKGVDPTVSATDIKPKPSKQELETAAPRLPVPASVILQSEDKKPKPSKQEVEAAAPVSSASSEISETTLQQYGLKPIETAASPAAHVPLPPSPISATHKGLQDKPQDKPLESHVAKTGEFPQDSFKLIKRQSTFRERGVAIVETLMAVPNMIAAFFVSIMSAFTDWLDAMFNPQRRARNDKEDKAAGGDKGAKEE